MIPNQNPTGLAFFYSKSQCRKMIREALDNSTARFQNSTGATSVFCRVNGREVEVLRVDGYTESERANLLVDHAFGSKGYRVERFKNRVEVVPNTFREAAPVEPTTVSALVPPVDQVEQPAAKPTTFGAKLAALVGSLFRSNESPETI